MTRPTAADLAAARQRLASRLQPSPLVESPWLSRTLGVPVWLKLETMQPTRSFKVRGAVNAVEHLVASRSQQLAPPSRNRRSEPLRLITASAGNHGAALAWAAARGGLPCTVITPASAPRAKRETITRLGADLRAIADDYDDAERRALELAAEPGVIYVSPYNDPDVIAGAGTIGLEILEQKPDVGTIVVPLGGGGLLAGIALSVEPRQPRVEVVGVEARRSPAFSTSLAAGRIVPIEVGETLADGLAGNLEAGSLTFDVIRDRAPQVIALSEAEIGDGIVDLAAEERLVAEGAGVMAVAALAAGRVPIDRGPIVAIVSGANIDIGVLATLLGSRGPGVNGGADQPAAAPREPSYGQLVRQNRNFRMLWFGQIVSQLGDWFNAVAVYALILDLTGSATAVALMMVVQQLPSSLVGPLAGVVIDRMDRRHVMVAADVVRGILVLGLLLVRDANQIWVAYLVIALAVSATAFFEPSRSAILPLVASRDELMPANALASATWSVMLAIGAAAGGAVTALAGREAAFVINSASFFASAVFIARIRLRPGAAPRGGVVAAPGHGRGFVDGLRYLRAHRDVAAYVGIKSVWALSGGVLLLLTVFGERVFPLGGSTAAGIGVLYAARGVGACVGSLVTGHMLGASVSRLRRGIGPAFLTVAVFYAALSVAPTLWLASLAVIGAHVGGSMLWVASAVLLQVTVPDQVRGRVFAIEFALLTLAVSVSSYATARVLDAFDLGPRPLTLALGLFFLVPAAAWWARGRRPTSSAASTA